MAEDPPMDDGAPGDDDASQGAFLAQLRKTADGSVGTMTEGVVQEAKREFTKLAKTGRTESFSRGANS